MKFLSQINVNSNYALPAVDGNTGQVLTTDGEGNAYWGTITISSASLNSLNDVAITNPSSGQVLTYGIQPGESVASWHNKTPPYLTTSSSIGALGDVSIGTKAVGNLLRWNGSNWVNWAPNFLTSYAETDPIYTASSWYTTTNNASNWNTAYGWGNHSGLYANAVHTHSVFTQAQNSSGSSKDGSELDFNVVPGQNGFVPASGIDDGGKFLRGDGTWQIVTTDLTGYATETWVGQRGYLTSYTETDPVFKGSAAYGISTENISGWNTMIEWGNHADAGYLKSYAETDPIYTGSSWYTTTNNSTNWNTAYGWGNHASAGYQAASTAITTSNIGSQYVEGANRLGSYTANTANSFQAWNLYESGTARLNPTADTWYYGMRISHGDAENYYSATLAISFFNEDLYLRRIQGGTPATWYRFWHNGDFGTGNISNWNTAYGWGDHAGLYADKIHSHELQDITGLTEALDLKIEAESDTLATVTGRGNSTSSNIRVKRPSNKIDNNSNPIEFGGRVEFNNDFVAGQSGYMVFRYPTYNNFLIGGDYDGNIGGAIPNIQFGRSSGDVYLHVGSNGNLGVGTTTPQVKLDVNGHVGIVGSNYLYFGHNTSNIGAWTTRQYSSGSTHYFNAVQFIFNNEGYGSYEHMRLTYTGLSLNGKQTIDSTDSWLRLNQYGDYTSGVYTPGILRNDGNFINYGGIYGYANIQARKAQTAGNYTTAALWTESYDNTTTGIAFHINGIVGKFLEMRTDGFLYWNSEKVATETWVAAQGYAVQQDIAEAVSKLVNSSPEALDTLGELANALGNDANFATTVTNSLATKVYQQNSQLANTNLNDLTTQGVYHSGDQYGTNPNIPYANYFTMINLTNDADRQAQLWFGDTPGRMYWRPRQGSSIWHGWEKVWTSSDFSNNSSNWDTAYGWGNHATANYWVTSNPDPQKVAAESVTFQYDVEIQGKLLETSSIRFKENIVDLEHVGDKVSKLRPVRYNKIGADVQEIGLIAEEVAELFPEVVHYNEDGEAESLNYTRLSVLLLQTVKELSDRIQKLENK